MYAIVKISGRQEKVEKGMQFDVNRMPLKEGEMTKIDTVLFAAKDSSYHIGKPFLKGAHVECEVVKHHRGDKVVAFKYKPKKGYHRTVGHRQDLTRLKVKEIKI